MPFVPDSTQAGYLGPTTETLEGDTWTDFLQAVIVGITNLPPDLVRPRWQPQPPMTPHVSTDWCAIGIMQVDAEFDPYVGHIDAGDGFDQLRRSEEVTLLASFYGPNSDLYGARLRDGLYIDQNRAALRANSVGLIEVGSLLRAADIFREQWRERTDVEVHLRRQVRRRYEVRNLLRSIGTITAQPPGETRVIEGDFDTATPPSFIEPPGPNRTYWDDGDTHWDDFRTVWDYP